MARLALQDVTVGLGGRDVVANASASAGEGELVVVVGPNGAGKTTLLRAIGGLVPVRSGSVTVMGHDPTRARRGDLAKDLAYLPQHYELAFPFGVEEVV
ncbi:MAG: ABC transporter ATP-binding protein, partial [Myxococcales bacterium]|nr:ABC transporter ATP-binding protein [Myxococcales bacterium]